ncbi:MAG: hypothetical protein KJ061_18390 [Vicinamibacteraceae bacterium]|nr:hypothetical protein [Vicinamibacteraceae bacterium]
MPTCHRRVAGIALVVVTALAVGLAACSRDRSSLLSNRPSRPISGTLPNPGAPTPVPPTPAPTPPLSGAFATYAYHAPLGYAVSTFTTRSAFVLYESGAFYLKYDAFEHRYIGSYETDQSRVLFNFGSDSRGGAIGTLKGGLLEVEFSDLMQHSDFENAVYRRVE